LATLLLVPGLRRSVAYIRRTPLLERTAEIAAQYPLGHGEKERSMRLIFGYLLYMTLLQAPSALAKDCNCELCPIEASWWLSRLPAVVPLVLYYGEALWTVPRQLADLFEPVPHGLERAFPRFSPLVLDVRREPLPETAGRDNLAALLFALERSRSLADLDRGVSQLSALLPGPLTGPLADLRRDFASYLRDGLLPRRFADLDGLALTDGLGESPLFRETVGSWTRHCQEEGRRRGVAECLARLLDLRFGPLDAQDRARLGEAEAERLLGWGERVLTAASLEEVFG
jgi:hypothetical protein